MVTVELEQECGRLSHRVVNSPLPRYGGTAALAIGNGLTVRWFQEIMTMTHLPSSKHYTTMEAVERDFGYFIKSQLWVGSFV